MSKQLTFGDIVVVDGNQIGVIVKSWLTAKKDGEPYHEVYVRNLRAILDYPESEIDRYLVRHKELDETEEEWQYNGVHQV